VESWEGSHAAGRARTADQAGLRRSPLREQLAVDRGLFQPWPQQGGAFRSAARARYSVRGEELSVV